MQAAGAADFSRRRPLRRAAISCGAGTGREEPNSLVRATPHFLPLFPISIFPPSPPFLPDSIGNFSLSLQSSQPLLTHQAFAGCRWLPRSILASRSARSAEQGNNSNSSDDSGPCSQTDRQKFTHTHTHKNSPRQLWKGFCMARSWTKAQCWVVWMMGGLSCFSECWLRDNSLRFFPSQLWGGEPLSL